MSINFIKKSSIEKLVKELNKEDLYSKITKEEYERNKDSDTTLDGVLLIYNFRKYLISKKLYILFIYTYLGFDYKMLSKKIIEYKIKL